MDFYGDEIVTELQQNHAKVSLKIILNSGRTIINS